MAARWSALALALQLLLAAALMAVLCEVAAPSRAVIAVSTVAALGGIALLVSAAPLVLARWGAPAAASAPRTGHLLRALWSDAFALEMQLARMALEPLRRPPDLTPAVPPLFRPVLLVHGLGCSCAVWRPLIARLRAAGFAPVRAVSLEPLSAGLETCASQLHGELEALVARGAVAPIVIVAHSMGGLAARAALRQAPPGLIGRIITLGTPHHGTALACRFSWPSARQMCPGSRWLEELNACQEGRLGIPVTTLYSLDDNYIFPAASARLQGARSIELEGLGHLALLTARTVLDRVVSELRA